MGRFSELGEVAVTAGVHTVAGAVSGAINSAITGSDIGMGTLTGAVGAGIGSVTGGALSYLKIDQFGFQLVARTVMGGVAGGVASEIYGGNFWQGFALGAGTAAAGFLFNECMHDPKTFPWLKQQPIPGQLAATCLLPGAVLVEGTVLVGVGAYFAPEFAALTVRYGTIYILGNPTTYQEVVNFITGLSPSPPLKG